MFSTFRYLATGCSFIDLHYSYRLGETTVREIVQEVCLAIWNSLKYLCLPKPSKEQWLTIAEKFNTNANFPHCIGAVDGKHIRVIKPHLSGSLNFNYKHFFSIVLLAICDANYKFIAINVGADGKEADSTVFKDSKFYSALENEELDIPVPSPLTPTSNMPMPYVLVGDEGFALTKHVMRPYAGYNLSVTKRVFNYRLTRARRFIECTFGILANKWRIFHRPLNVERGFAINIVNACCVLHNFVRSRDGNRQAQEETQNENDPGSAGLHDTPQGNMTRAGRDASRYRDMFAQYFVNEGKLDWQYTHV